MSSGNVGEGKSRAPERLARAARVSPGAGSPAPVHQWSPPFSGRLDMRIDRNGQWHYQGSVIRREALVRLFARILRREEDGSFCLVTPVERWEIEVEDAPFLAVDFDLQDPGAAQRIEFETNVGDRVTAGAGHAIRTGTSPGRGACPLYLHVRGGLEARVDRKSFYRLAEIAEHVELRGVDWFGVRSAGEFFGLLPSTELDAEK